MTFYEKLGQELYEQIKARMTPGQMEAMKRLQIEAGGLDVPTCASHEFHFDPNQILIDLLEKYGFSMPPIEPEKEFFYNGRHLKEDVYNGLIMIIWYHFKKLYLA